MAHLIGTTHVDRFTLIDDLGAPITGEVFVADVARDPQGDSFAWEVIELGSGLYEVRFDLASAGLYYLRLLTTLTSPLQIHEISLLSDDYEAGDTATHYLTVRDDDGNLYNGAIFTVLDSYDPAGEPFVPDVANLDAGLYRVTWTTAAAGLYTVRLSADLSAIDDDNQLFELESQVLPSTQDAETPFASVLGTSLDDLVRDTAVACRDYLDTKASIDSTDGQTWHDDLALAARSPKSFKGASLFVTKSASAENIGREVRIRDSVEGGLTLTPSLPAVVRREDEGYLTNLDSNGFPRQTYVNQINARIWGSFPNTLRPAVWTFRDPLFSAESPYLVPPPEFTHLSDVAYPAGVWTPTETSIPMTDVNRAGWYWDQANDRIVIQGGYATEGSGREIRIRGFGRWPKLTSNAEQTGIDAQWLVEMTAGMMIQSLRDAKRLSEAAMHTNRADGYLLKAITQLPANTIRIR